MTTLTFSRNGKSFSVPTNDRAVALRVFSSGPSETATLEAAVNVLEAQEPPRGDSKGRFLEIGANLGTASVTAVRDFGFDSLTCFEPLPSNFDFLVRNLEINDLLPVANPIQMAVSSSNGIVDFEIPEENSGDGRIHVDSPTPGYFGEHSRDVLQVEAITLDTYLSRTSETLEDVGLVWIDAQGSEAKILQGAGQLLESRIPIVIELWPYGLERAGDKSLLVELVSHYFSRIIDLGASGGPETYPSSSIDALLGEYAQESFFDPKGAHGSTDLLLLTD